MLQNRGRRSALAAGPPRSGTAQKLPAPAAVVNPPRRPRARRCYSILRGARQPRLTLRTRIPFILASTSPRRRHLLEVLGLNFSVDAETVSEEPEPGWTPADTVEHLSLRKAEAVAQRRRDALVLGADTIVVLDGHILGKPADRDDAIRMLELLSGRTHQVYTGFALVHANQNRRVVRREVTDVRFAPLDRDEIEAYVRTGSPMDKAGAYGIQEDLGATFVASVRGDYYTVVGLPLHRLYRTLREEFGDLLDLVN